MIFKNCRSYGNGTGCKHFAVVSVETLYNCPKAQNINTFLTYAQF